MKNYASDKIGSFCLPSLGDSLKKITDAFGQSSNIEASLESVRQTSNLIWGSVIFTFLLAYFFSWLLEHCPGVVVVISLVGFYGGAGYMAYLSYTNYKKISADEEDTILKGKRRFFQIALFTISGTLLITTCVICCFWSQLMLATKIIGVST